MIVDNNRGFTLIELLVVISIIGVLSSVVFASIQGARTKAIKTKYNSIIYEYTKAYLLYANDYETFPLSGTSGGSYCLGDFSDNKCGILNSSNEHAQLNAAFATYYPSLPVFEAVTLDTDVHYPFEGPLYSCVLVDNPPPCADPRILWALPGTSDDPVSYCNIPGARPGSLGGHGIVGITMGASTYCQMALPI